MQTTFQTDYYLRYCLSGRSLLAAEEFCASKDNDRIAALGRKQKFHQKPRWQELYTRFVLKDIAELEYF